MKFDKQKDVRYAGFYVRLVASLLDTIFLALPIGVVVYFLSDGSWFDFSAYEQNLAYAMAGDTTNALSNQPHTSLKWELLFEFLTLFVTMLFWDKFRGATPGKKLLHIKIVDAKTLEDIDNKQALTRTFGYVVSALIFFIGFVMVGFTKRKRGLHDFLANSVVIYDETAQTKEI